MQASNLVPEEDSCSSNKKSAERPQGIYFHHPSEYFNQVKKSKNITVDINIYIELKKIIKSQYTAVVTADYILLSL